MLEQMAFVPTNYDFFCMSCFKWDSSNGLE